METLTNNRPVTFGLVTAVVGVVLTVAPVAAWGAQLHGRVISLETAQQLRGAQLDRIESKLDQLRDRIQNQLVITPK